jgi:autotransporter-associated beta strand protein
MTYRSRPNGGFNGGNATATLTIASNAIANVKGDLVKGTSGQGTSTLNLNNGGLLNMMPAGDTVPGNVTVDSLTINGGTLQNASNVTVSGTVALTSTTLTNVGGTLSAGTLTLNTNATVLSISNITVSGSLNLNANSTVLNSSNITVTGTVNLNGGNITNGLALTAGTITGSGAIANVVNVTNGSSLLPGSTSTAGTVIVGNNLTLKTNASLTFALGSATTIGGGVNSYVNVGGNLTLLSNNTISIAPLDSLASGTYRLMDYDGSLSGLTPILTNTTRSTLSLDLSIANQINLTSGGGVSSNLTWNGATTAGGTNWAYLTATNWNNQTQPFYQFDTVTFDSNGATTNINTAGTLYPQSITVNDSRNYSLLGSGKISGNASITKSGSGTLFIANTGGNDFNGAIVVNPGGILKIGRADAFGSTNGTTTIASGATLDLFGTSAYSPGEFVTISGTGINGTGAITNSGADQQNALRYVSLAADASTGINAPGRWDIRGSGGNSSFSGGLYLNGFTYTKTGPGTHELADIICTNSGSLVNNGGILAFTRSIVDGPGTVTAYGASILQLENNSTGMVAKPFVFHDTSMLQLVGNSFVLSSPVTNLNTGSAGLTIDVASGSSLTMTNVLTGSGAVTKTSSGSLILQAPDSCTGPTAIAAGSVVLTNAGSLANTPSISLAATTTVLDVSSVGGLTLSSAQTLSGSGTVIGNLATSAGTTIIPGNSLGTLTVSGDLALNGTTNIFELGSDPTQIGNGVNDLIAVGHNLTLTGVNTMRITPVAGLDTTTPYTLLTYSNTLIGGLANLAVSSSNPRYTFSLVDPATTPGAIKVSVVGIPVTLAWLGGQPGNPTVWNTGTTPNWLDGASPDVFYSGDTVVFDDTALTNLVTLSGTAVAGSVIFNNNALNYTLAGPGGLTAGSLTKAGSGSATLANAGTNTFGSGITLNAGTLALNYPSNQTLATVIIDDGYGQGTIEKQGTNTLTMAGNNAAFNGALRVSNGTLKLGNVNAVGTTVNGTTITSGGTLDLNGLNLGAEPITVSGAGVGALGAIVNSGANQNNAVINVTMTDHTTVGGSGRWDIRTQGANNATLLTGGQPYNLTKMGTNQFSLVNAALDDALADINVQQGMLSLEHITRAPSGGIGDASRTLTIFTNATLQINSLDYGVNKVIVMRDGSTITNQGGDNVISGPITLNGSNVLDVGATTLSLTALNSLSGYALNGPGKLIKNGGGILDLYSANNFSGGVLINAGTLAIDNSLSFGANQNIMVTTTTGGGGNTGTRITLGITAGGAWTIPPGVSVNLPSSQPNDLRSGLYANKGTTEWQGPITCYAQAGAVTPGSVQFTSDAATSVFTVSGPISGVLTNLILRGNNQGIGKVYGSINVSNPGGLPPRMEKTDVSLWTLYTNNNVWGDTIVHNGILQLGTNNALPVIGFLTVGQSATPCVFDLNGFNQQVTGLGSDVNPAYQFVGNSSTTSDSTLTILGTNVTTYAGFIKDQAPTWDTTNFFGSQRLGLTLAAGNTGSLTLGGINAYTGPTLLNGGTLLVNGSLSNTVVTVNSGATLGGTGVIAGPVSVNNGGTLALGAAIGTLAISNNVSLAAGSTNVMKVNLNNLTSDQLVGASTLAYGGTLVVNNVGTAAFTGGTTLKLFDAAAYVGDFASIAPAVPGPGMTWDTSSLKINGTLKVVGSGVNPTPITMAIAINGSQLTFSWPTDHIGWSLQTNAVDVSNPSLWFTLPGSTVTNEIIINIDQSRANVFYRMALPQ